MTTRISLEATGNTLLAYSLGTNPDPLQASPQSGSTMLGTLTIVVSNPNTQQYIYVTSITFSFPEGTGAQQLTNVDTGMVPAASPSATWNFSQTGVGTFKATPASGTSVQMGLNGAVFEISNIVLNSQPGNVPLTITEVSGVSSSGPFASTTGTLTVPKFPYGFFFENLTPSAPAVLDGQTVTLSWEASDGPTYTLFYPSGQTVAQVDVTEVRAWTSPALHSDATFLLQAVYQQSGQSVTTSLSTTVIVPNGEAQLTALAVTTTVQMVGVPQTLTPPSSTGGNQGISNFSAPTDGLVFGFVGANNSGQSTQQSIGWITIKNSTNVFVAATGGNYIPFEQQNPPPAPQIQFSYASLNQSIFLPVRKGEQFSITVQFSGANQSAPQVNFWFIPLGAGTATTVVQGQQAAKELPPGVGAFANFGTTLVNG